MLISMRFYCPKTQPLLRNAAIDPKCLSLSSDLLGRGLGPSLALSGKRPKQRELGAVLSPVSASLTPFLAPWVQ